MKSTICVGILLLIEVVCFTSCRGNRNTYYDNSKTHADYNINHYVDTIDDHVILITVCDKSNSLSVSTLELSK